MNGEPVTVGAHEHLLAALRDELGVTSPKDGCSPSGQCGCCAVLIDGGQVIDCGNSANEARYESEYQGLEHLLIPAFKAVSSASLVKSGQSSHRCGAKL